MEAKANLIAWPGFLQGSPALSQVVTALTAGEMTTAAELLNGQARQLAVLARWATREARHYRRQAELARELANLVADPERFWQRWRDWPLLGKPDLRRNARDFHVARLPAGHDRPVSVLTSGSTGIPVEVRTTQVTRLMWDALGMRDHLWHARDFKKRFGIIRFRPKAERSETGIDLPTWGPPTNRLRITGPASVIHIDTPMELLLAWLRRFDPHYLLTYPSLANELFRELEAAGARPAALEEVRLISEPVDESLEQRLTHDWGLRVSEIYSANEVGTIALRCPEGGRLHAQSESVLVEILDDAGRPCAPGETGRVVVTALLNAATPLLRYDIGDYATAGPACSCGRGSPTFGRILGRVRNLVTTPDGGRFWPVGLVRIGRVKPIVQAQFVQTRPDTIELRAVTSRPLTESEVAQAQEITRTIFKYPFEVPVRIVESIERGPTGKFEEFLSLVAG